MNIYERYIAPRLVNCLCSMGAIKQQREKVVPLARGDVVEIGFGAGLNLPLYDASKVTSLIGVDPGAEMIALKKAKSAHPSLSYDVLMESAEQMSLKDESADSVVITYSLCTIPRPLDALHEARRILKPSGQLLFCEHGRSDKHSTAKWQDRINPIWSHIAAGCNINRNMRELVSEAGFTITKLENFILPATPAFVGYHYLGQAAK